RYFGEGLPYLKPWSVKGKLIVIEGTDGVGRSTQVALLKNWLEVKGYAVVETGWARSNLMHKSIELAKTGNIMDRMTFTLLYATDFADRLENQILPALKSGHIVLADRYIYTAFVRDVVRQSDPTWIRNLFSFALVPDIVLHLRIDIESLIPRVIEAGGMNYWEAGMDLHMGQDLFDSFVNYQGQLIAEYGKLAKEFAFESIDARKSVDEIQEDIRNRVKGILARPKPPKAREIDGKEETKK
ncbi:MAG TPA: thymidylate kinase, partial [Candidatus Eisenbacteria bacterium]|nr:thymidylate kinase [Candidatus Eisenbacteria bacterium]